VFALVDSGADVCILSFDLFNAINAKGDHKLHMTSPLIQRVSVANGDTQRVIGKVVCNVTITSDEVKPREFVSVACFNVLHNIQPALILGRDFLMQNAACLDFGSCSLKLKKAKIFAEFPFVVPPNSESVVIARIRAKVPNGVVGIVEPNRFVRSLNLASSHVLTSSNNGEIHMRLLNPSKVPVTVRQSTCLGHIDWLAAGDSISLLENPTTTECKSTTTTPAVNACSAQRQPQPAAKAKVDVDLSQCTLNEGEKHELADILNEFSDVFASSMNDLTGCNIGIEHEIATGNAPPIRSRPYRINPTERQLIDQTVNELKEAGIITESISPWSSPILLVRKSNNTTRAVCDFRKLNSVSKFSAYTMPPIQECLDTVGAQQPKIFSTFDCFSGYFQIPLDKASQEKTAFIPYAGGGQYQFLRLPMGVSGGTATFQRVIERVLGPLHWTVALTYIDDIILFSQSWDQHKVHLRQLLHCLRKANLKLKASKCTLAASSVKYLGHFINEQGVQPNNEKVAAVESYPPPSDLRSLKTYLGMVGFYRRYIADFAHIAEPLLALTRSKARYVWTTQCQQAFETLKHRLINAPILAFPNWNLPFHLSCDASGYAAGYVLSQVIEGKERPVAYGGRSFNEHERKYSPTEAEAAAVIAGIKHFDMYLRGNEFTVFTDHAALVWMFNIKAPTGRLARWAMFLQQYKHTIKSKPGKSNANADGLSRRHYSDLQHNMDAEIDEYIDPFDAVRSIAVVETNNSALPVHAVKRKKRQQTEDSSNNGSTEPDALNLPPHVPRDQLVEMQTKDPCFELILSYLMYNKLPQDSQQARWTLVAAADYHLIDGVLYHTWIRGGKGPKEDRCIHQLAVPSVLRDLVLQHCHDLSAHFGVARTLDKVRFAYYWPKMGQDVAAYVRSCDTCAKRKEPYTRTRAPLQPLVASQPFEILEMDILGKLPLTAGNNSYLLVLQDWFTKWPIVIPLPDISATTVATALLQKVLLIYGPCKQLQTDLGKQFTAALLKEICNYFCINKSFSTAYRPQVQGLVERFNSTLLQSLSKLCNDRQSDWDRQLQTVLWAYSTTPHSSTGYSPYKLLFGREPTTALDLCLKPQVETLSKSHRQYLAEITESLEMTRAQALSNIEDTRQKMSAHYNEKKFDPEFELGDVVYIYTPVLKGGQTSRKLMLPWAGPFRLVERTSEVHFKVRRCSDNKLLPHKIHVNRFKRAYEWAKTPHEEHNTPEEVTSDDLTIQDLTPQELHEADNQTTDEEHTLPLPSSNDSDQPDTAEDVDQPSASQQNYHQIKKILYARKTDNGIQYQVRWLNYKTPEWVNESDLSPVTAEYLRRNPVPFKRPYIPRK
jgi:hypothetical protein